LGCDEISVARFSRMLANDTDSKKLMMFLATIAVLIVVKFLAGVLTLNIGLESFVLLNWN